MVLRMLLILKALDLVALTEEQLAQTMLDHMIQKQLKVSNLVSKQFGQIILSNLMHLHSLLIILINKKMLFYQVQMVRSL